MIRLVISPLQRSCSFRAPTIGVFVPSVLPVQAHVRRSPHLSLSLCRVICGIHCRELHVLRNSKCGDLRQNSLPSASGLQRAGGRLGCTLVSAVMGRIAVTAWHSGHRRQEMLVPWPLEGPESGWTPVVLGRTSRFAPVVLVPSPPWCAGHVPACPRATAYLAPRGGAISPSFLNANSIQQHRFIFGR